MFECASIRCEEQRCSSDEAKHVFCECVQVPAPIASTQFADDTVPTAATARIGKISKGGMNAKNVCKNATNPAHYGVALVVMYAFHGPISIGGG